MTAANATEADESALGGVEEALSESEQRRRRARLGNPDLHARVAQEADGVQNRLNDHLRRAASASKADLMAFAEEHFPDGRAAVRRRGLLRVLDWLSDAPGDTWQDKWLLLDGDRTWTERDRSLNENGRWLWRLGTEVLLVAGALTPSWPWMLAPRRGWMHHRVLAIRHPEWESTLRSAVQELGVTRSVVNETLVNISRLCATTGKAVSALTVEDLLRAHESVTTVSRSRNSQLDKFHLAYQVLRTTGVLPAESPGSLAAARRAGQLTPARMVERYGIKSPVMRRLFTSYLTEREPSIDYSTLQTLGVRLIGNFWREIEKVDPNANSLHLPNEVWHEWKRRIKHEPSERTKSPRKAQDGIFTTVRAFFLDIADWAQERPEMWAEHVAPCPIARRELGRGARTATRERKSRMDHRTRTLAPRLPALRESTLARLEAARTLLQQVEALPFGGTISSNGETWTRVPPSRHSHNVRIRDSHGATRNLTHEEDDTFWQWAVVEALTILGPRIEELLELTAFDIVPWIRKGRGTIMLLRINPSKTESERVLPLTRDQAAIFARIVRRIRGTHSHVPYVSRYDQHERTQGPDLPHLFQRSHNGQRRVISYPTIINLLNRAVEAAGIKNGGQTLHFRPHDFRRMFVTEHVNSGLPIHIVAALVGHGSLDTTRAYAAVYPEQVILGYLAHVAERRERRPAAEYEQDEASAVEHRKAFNAHFGQ